MKAMKQRNTLLRYKKETAIEAWEYAMAQAAHYLLKKRDEGLAQLIPFAQSCLASLSHGQDQLEIQMQSTLEDNSSVDSLAERWAKNRKKELYFGTTLIGPHRDELLLTINGRSARNYSSEGQKRSLVTALRLAEWKRLKNITCYSPLICIDDFGIHLDAKRYALIQKEVEGGGQVFLTTPLLLESPAQADQSLFVERGILTRAPNR
jgi:DNA replication and repair protein RecF